jgi:hypothetical protein
MAPSQLRRLASLALAALTVTGCASVTVRSYPERGNDFTRYRTYGWAPADRLSTGDPRLDNNSLFAEWLQAAVERQLAGRGFEKTTAGSPDLLLRYHASVIQRINVRDADRQYSDCDHDDCGPYVYEAGTLLLDFIDAHTNRVVWRGVAERALDGVIDRQDLLEQTIDDAVERILKRLPRRL